MKIITNRHWRPFLDGCELTEKEKKEFDWIEDIDSEPFLRYKGELYPLSEFQLIDKDRDPRLDGWHGVVNLTAFSWVMVELSEDGDKYRVAYCWS
jgi:hypothetical protein